MNPTELNESNTFAAWQNPLNFASPRFGRAWAGTQSEQTSRMEIPPARCKGRDRNGGRSQREERIPSFAGISHTREAPCVVIHHTAPTAGLASRLCWLFQQAARCRVPPARGFARQCSCVRRTAS